MPDPEALYVQAAREAEDQWARQLAGSEEPPLPSELERLLGDLLDLWIEQGQGEGPSREGA